MQIKHNTNILLGSFYSKEKTIFRVFALDIDKIELLINDNKSFLMHQIDTDIYEVEVKEDLELSNYLFKIYRNGKIIYAKDPYCRATSLNSEYSVVVDLNKLNSIKKINSRTMTDNLLDCIIYELNIRDFSEDNNSNILNKGKFLGLVEENRTTSGGHPAGIDYLKYLGITHVQLLPVLDFFGVDDINWHKNYNWGYDPISFFALEGSYSTDPHNPYSRMIEFKQMISSLHNHDICAIIDVVYNHVYKFEDSDLEKLCPNYYFRKDNNGAMSNGSGCGNDFASEKPMARKLLIESAKNLVELYDIDGFRFDLMGLIDIKTIELIKEECQKIKKDLVFYGEGWNIPTSYDENKLATIKNSSKLLDIGFFNDFYRDILRGSTFEKEKKGFVSGDLSYRYGLEFSFYGCSLNYSYHPMFKSCYQSINYIECHDNNTLYDKLSYSNKEESKYLLLKRVELANFLLLISLGVSFLHAGQEFGDSKDGIDNSYNILHVNKFSYELVDKRFSMIKNMKKMIEFRKNYLFYTTIKDSDKYKDLFKFYTIGNILIIEMNPKEENIGKKKIKFLINNSEKDEIYTSSEYFKLFNNDEKYKKIMIPGISYKIIID